MALPNPLPDNPMRWDGWRLYSSGNPYERLCLEFDAAPSDEQIESNCRQLLQWWQKKLPLKNQPSNPLAQLLRSGMDEAPAKLAEARTLLLEPQSRAAIDQELLAAEKSVALAEFYKFLSFVLTGGELDPDEEQNLYKVGDDLGLKRDEMERFVQAELDKWGMKRVPNKTVQAPPPSGVPVATVPAAPLEARSEFLRMLRLSILDEITDDQRDAFCNMGEALGLSGGDAEDIIDEYLEERMAAGTASPPVAPVPPVDPIAPAPKFSPRKADPVASRPANTPLQRAEERQAYPDFCNTVGIPMRLVPSGSFLMGSEEPGAAPHEQPVTKVNLSAYYLSRWPVTNAQYEQFDPTHRNKRAPGAGVDHPVVHVSHAAATQFCAWLSSQEHRKYRLPSEAEWDYAARGEDGRKFPWGNQLDANDLANFADANKKLPWADRTLDCGFESTSPVGSFPRGASPFGMEDMAGNVWEWCLDCLGPYRGRECTQPQGPLTGGKQIQRGGSWKSRSTSLRTSARGANSPAYSANDVGFRILCECGR
jgi:formylglycine-generating enzyme required for sulfatase activity